MYYHFINLIWHHNSSKYPNVFSIIIFRFAVIFDILSLLVWSGLCLSPQSRGPTHTKQERPINFINTHIFSLKQIRDHPEVREGDHLNLMKGSQNDQLGKETPQVRLSKMR